MCFCIWAWLDDKNKIRVNIVIVIVIVCAPCMILFIRIEVNWSFYFVANCNSMYRYTHTHTNIHTIRNVRNDTELKWMFKRICILCTSMYSARVFVVVIVGLTFNIYYILFSLNECIISLQIYWIRLNRISSKRKKKTHKFILRVLFSKISIHAKKKSNVFPFWL